MWFLPSGQLVRLDGTSNDQDVVEAVWVRGDVLEAGQNWRMPLNLPTWYQAVHWGPLLAAPVWPGRRRRLSSAMRFIATAARALPELPSYQAAALRHPGSITTAAV